MLGYRAILVHLDASPHSAKRLDPRRLAREHGTPAVTCPFAVRAREVPVPLSVDIPRRSRRRRSRSTRTIASARDGSSVEDAWSGSRCPSTVRSTHIAALASPRSASSSSSTCRSRCARSRSRIRRGLRSTSTGRTRDGHSLLPHPQRPAGGRAAACLRAAQSAARRLHRPADAMQAGAPSRPTCRRSPRGCR